MKKIIAILLITALVFTSGCVQNETPANGQQNPQQSTTRALTSEEERFVNATMEFYCILFSGLLDENSEEQIYTKYGFTVSSYEQLVEKYNDDPVVTSEITSRMEAGCTTEMRELTPEEQNYVNAFVELVCLSPEGDLSEAEQTTIASKYGLTLDDMTRLSEEYSNNAVVSEISSQMNEQCPDAFN